MLIFYWLLCLEDVNSLTSRVVWEKRWNALSQIFRTGSESTNDLLFTVAQNYRALVVLSLQNLALEDFQF